MERVPEGDGSGGGSGMPSLEIRVMRLEEKVDSLASTLKSIDAKLSTTVESLAEIRGRVSQSPTWIQLLMALIATWGAGAAIVAALIRYAPK
jgi:hypothetical protein